MAEKAASQAKEKPEKKPKEKLEKKPKEKAPKKSVEKPTEPAKPKKPKRMIRKKPGRLYAKAVFTGFQRGQRNQNENCALLSVEGSKTQSDSSFYVGKKCVFVYKVSTVGFDQLVTPILFGNVSYFMKYFCLSAAIDTYSIFAMSMLVTVELRYFLWFW